MVREVTGDIAIVKNTHCLHNVIANFGRERSNNHNTSSFPLLLYFVCQKQVYKSQLHFAARSPVSVSPCPCFSVAVPVILVLALLIPTSACPSLSHTGPTSCWAAPWPAALFRSLTMDNSLKSKSQDLSTHFLCLFAFLDKPSEFIKTSKNKKKTVL